MTMNEFQAGKNLLSGHILVMVAARFLMPGGYIPRLEIMEREAAGKGMKMLLREDVPAFQLLQDYCSYDRWLNHYSCGGLS